MRRIIRTRFTLIELLMVIGIIAMLAALLLPALRNARERGNQISCSGKQRQIGQAFNMYVDDNNGWLIYLSGVTSFMNKTTAYIDPAVPSVYEYAEKLKANIVYHCPSATIDDSWSGGLYYAYGVNEHMHSYNSTSSWWIQKISGIRYAEKALLLTDANFLTLYNDTSHFSFRHNAKANLLYLDNHNSSMSYTNAAGSIIGANTNFWYGR